MNPVRPLFRPRVATPLGTHFGYFIPNIDEWKKERVCEEGCPLGDWEWVWTPELLHLEATGGPQGDFMTAIGSMLARVEIADELASLFPGLDPKPIVVRKPKGRRAREAEETYHELRPTLRLPLDPEAPNIRRTTHCPRCGRSSYEVLGAETEPGEEKIGERWEPVPGRPREPRGGFLVKASELGDRGFARSPLGSLLCTAEVREHVLSRGWTNVRFLEEGEIVTDV